MHYDLGISGFCETCGNFRLVLWCQSFHFALFITIHICSCKLSTDSDIVGIVTAIDILSRDLCQDVSTSSLWSFHFTINKIRGKDTNMSDNLCCLLKLNNFLFFLTVAVCSQCNFFFIICWCFSSISKFPRNSVISMYLTLQWHSLGLVSFIDVNTLWFYVLF